MGVNPNDQNVLQALGIEGKDAVDAKVDAIFASEKRKQELKDAYNKACTELAMMQRHEIDENGNRLTRKPNTGLKLGSYKFKSKK